MFPNSPTKITDAEDVTPSPPPPLPADPPLPTEEAHPPLPSEDTNITSPQNIPPPKFSNTFTSVSPQFSSTSVVKTASDENSKIRTVLSLTNRIASVGIKRPLSLELHQPITALDREVSVVISSAANVVTPAITSALATSRSNSEPLPVKRESPPTTALPQVTSQPVIRDHVVSSSARAPVNKNDPLSLMAEVQKVVRSRSRQADQMTYEQQQHPARNYRKRTTALQSEDHTNSDVKMEQQGVNDRCFNKVPAYCMTYSKPGLRGVDLNSETSLRKLANCGVPHCDRDPSPDRSKNERFFNKLPAYLNAEASNVRARMLHNAPAPAASQSTSAAVSPSSQSPHSTSSYRYD